MDNSRGDGRGRPWATVDSDGAPSQPRAAAAAAVGTNHAAISLSGAAFETSDGTANDLRHSNLTLFGQPSISEAIAASETLEEFEERERQIARQLDDEALQRAGNATNTMESDDTSLPSQQRPGPSPNSGASPVDYLRTSPTSDGFEPPTPPALMRNFSRYAVPAPNDSYQPYGPSSDRRSAGSSAQPSASSRNGQSPTGLANAMSSSLAFAGGMAAAVAGSASPTAVRQPSSSCDIVYGSDLPSRTAPVQNYYYEPTNRQIVESKTAVVASDSATPFPVTADLSEVLGYVAAYAPQDIEIEPILQPFLLDYIPAVGDVDPFIKIPRPDGEDQLLGLTVLDEPAEQQSDEAWLDLQLHQRARRAADAPVRALSRADRNKQQIERWITSTREARKSRPPDRLKPSAGGAQPVDVEALMQEWPEQLEQLLNREMLPNASLDVPLTDYVDICLALADIPLRDGRRVAALHTLFSVYLEFRSSQHFRSLAANNNNNNNADNNMYRNETVGYGRTARGRAPVPKRPSGSSYSVSPWPASPSQNQLVIL